MISEFEKEKVFWTRKMNLKLVNFIKGKQHIWNPKHSKYTSVELRDRTYSRFAAKYGDQFSGQAVKERWTNIRSTFASYVRKVKAASAAGQEYKVNWHLWEACQFLLNIKKEHIANHINEISQPDDHNDMDHSIPSISDECAIEDTDKSKTKLDHANISCKTLATNLVKVFHSVQNDAFGSDTTKYGKVGRAVTTKLSQMNSYDAGKLSLKIMEILLKYEDRSTDHYSYNMDDIKNELL